MTLTLDRPIAMDTLFSILGTTTVSVEEDDAGRVILSPIIGKKTIRMRRARKSLAERFEGYTGTYRCSEWNTGERIGEEVL